MESKNIFAFPDTSAGTIGSSELNEQTRSAIGNLGADIQDYKYNLNLSHTRINQTLESLESARGSSEFSFMVAIVMLGIALAAIVMPIYLRFYAQIDKRRFEFLHNIITLIYYHISD